MSDILIGEFLLKRIRELGIGTIFGVPGDFELALLDLIPRSGLKWIGTPNELVGAYAADGYARQNGAAALVTTFGPGELSALCGVGGAYCEFVPMVHIVGYPTIAARKSGKILHHTLGDLNHDHYAKMSAEISCATAVLNDPVTAAAEIDRVLNAMVYHSQPVYIGISEDIAYSKIPASAFDCKLALRLPPSDLAVEEQVISEVVSKLQASKSPAIMVDGGAARGNWAHHVDALVNLLKIPAFVTTLGKGALNESSPYYAGAYAGVISWPNVIKQVEESDCILWLGNMPADFNTGAFTMNVTAANVVDFQRFFIKIGETKYNAKINFILPKLIEAISTNKSFTALPNRELIPRPPIPQSTTSNLITQDWLWDRLSSFLKPGDLIVTETGTAQAGVLSTRLPKGASHWTQAVWGSIGYASGAAVGASISAKESGKFKRCVLITGDGSLQLTVQAFSLLSRHGIVPVVFILNNGGYTVERFFCGWNAEYNDVPEWDYVQMFPTFAPNTGARAFKANTRGELDALLNEHAVQNASYPQAIDLVLSKYDIATPAKWGFEKQKGKA